MAEAKWTGILSTTEPRNDIGILNVRQGNLNSETVEFQIIQNNRPYDLSGTKVNFCANFGLSAVQKSAVVKDAINGIISFTFNDQSMQEIGRQIAYFQINKDGVMIDSTQDFEFRIESSILSRKMEAGSYIESFEKVLETLGNNSALSLFAELEQKATKGDIGITDLDKNKIQFDETWFADSVKEQWAGDAPVNATPADHSITTKKLVQKAVTPDTTSFIETDTTTGNKVNIMPATLGTKGNYYDPASGSISNNQYTQSFKPTGKLPTGEFKTFESYGVASWIFFKGESTYVSGVSLLDEKQQVSQVITVPVDAVYMIGNVKDFYFPIGDPNRSPYPKSPAYSKYVEEKYIINKLVVSKGNLSFDMKDELINRFSEVTVVDLGDSVIGNKNPSISEFIAADLGANVINGGFGGCMMSPHPNTEYAKFSMTSIADAIATGVWTSQEGATGVPSSFAATVAILKSTNWSDVDIITISYGTNDWLNSNILDDTTNKLNKATYLGALRYSVKTILQKYPHIKILVTTPIFRSTNDRTENSDNWKNGNNIYMKDVADALILVGKEIKIPIADTFYGLGINAWNESYYFPSTDGTHPNAFGRKLLAQKIANEIRRIY